MIAGTIDVVSIILVAIVIEVMSMIEKESGCRWKWKVLFVVEKLVCKSEDGDNGSLLY